MAGRLLVCGATSAQAEAEFDASPSLNPCHSWLEAGRNEGTERWRYRRATTCVGGKVSNVEVKGSVMRGTYTMRVLQQGPEETRPDPYDGDDFVEADLVGGDVGLGQAGLVRSQAGPVDVWPGHVNGTIVGYAFLSSAVGHISVRLRAGLVLQYNV